MKPTITFNVAPFQLSGTVYGTLLNHRPAFAALGDAVHQPPYKAPPKAPILYVKPRNTLASFGDFVEVPADPGEVEIGAALGIVVACTTCRVDEDRAFEHIAGYTIVNDISVPHASFYRPAVRFKARDGFCPIGPGVVAKASIADPDALAVRVFVDDNLILQTSTADMFRPVARLLVDVTEFMTLAAGDVLMLGVAAGAPRVRAGQRSAIEIEGIGRLENSFKGATR